MPASAQLARSRALLVEHAPPVHILCQIVYSGDVEASHRINVSLDPEDAEKLRRLAERTRVQEGTLARSLLAAALDEADPDAHHVVELLDGIPGALERAQLGLQDAHAGRTRPLADL